MATIYKYPQWLMPENSNQSKVSNYSFEFDGTNDQINLDSNIPFVRAGGQHFSISAWVYCNSASQNGFFSTAVNASFAGQINLYKNGSRAAILLIVTASTGNIEIRSSPASITSNNWHHIVATFDGTQAAAADRVNIYVNGVLDNAYQSGTGTNLPTGSSFIFNRIGRTALGIRQNGKIDNLAIWDSTLTAGNVTTLYNSGEPVDVTTLSPPYAWKLGEAETFTDNWLVNNSALSNYSTRSFLFDGVDDYINCGTDSSLKPTSNYSVSGWFKLDDVTGTKTIISNDNNNGYMVWVSGSSLWFYHYDTGWKTLQSNTVLSADTWYHFCITWELSTTTGRLYINGSEDINSTSFNQVTYLSTPVYIGTYAPSKYFEGSLDEIAVFNTTLSSSDVSSIYNSGTPTTITGAVAHWRMGEEATFSTNWTVPDQVGSNDGTSANMDLADLEGDAPNYTGGGLSSNMTIEDRVGEAPSSTSNALSYNMTESDRETDVPT